MSRRPFEVALYKSNLWTQGLSLIWAYFVVYYIISEFFERVLWNWYSSWWVKQMENILIAFLMLFQVFVLNNEQSVLHCWVKIWNCRFCCSPLRVSLWGSQSRAWRGAKRFLQWSTVTASYTKSLLFGCNNTNKIPNPNIIWVGWVLVQILYDHLQRRNLIKIQPLTFISWIA